MSGEEAFDVDAYFEEYTEELRGDLMDAFRQLHDTMEPAVDSLDTPNAREALEEALRKVEKVEHMLLKALAADELWADIGEAMEES